MADRNPAVAIAFLFLVLKPQMAVSGMFPRFKLNPRTPQQVRNFFTNHASATNAGMYILSFIVGTGHQAVSGALDINSELVWMQCSCTDCSAPAPGSTLFDPSQSSTMANESCTGSTCKKFIPQMTCPYDYVDSPCYYTYMYGGGRANTTGYLATDTFWFDSDPVGVELTFGCGLYNVGDFGGASGIIGLGWGDLSLVSQLNVSRFSYYFAPEEDDDSSGGAQQQESFIVFGSDATPMGSSVLSSTRLLQSPLVNPNSYYVGLTGIRVDGQDLTTIPTGTFDLQADGSGGVVLSIKIPVTFLDERAYKPLKQSLMNKIGLTTVDGSELGLDLCYTSQSLATATIPAMALVFEHNNVMELQTWNYFYMDAITGLECLSLIPVRGGSFLGSLIQAGTHMIYDRSNKMLLFESFQQPSPPPPLLPTSKGSPRIHVLSLVLVQFVYVLYWAALF